MLIKLIKNTFPYPKSPNIIRELFPLIKITLRSRELRAYVCAVYMCVYRVCAVYECIYIYGIYGCSVVFIVKLYGGMALFVYEPVVLFNGCERERDIYVRRLWAADMCLYMIYCCFLSISRSTSTFALLKLQWYHVKYIN